MKTTKDITGEVIEVTDIDAAIKNYKKLFPSTLKAIEKGKRLTKCDMGYQIGHVEAYHPASIYWDKMSRDYMVKAFNKVFGTSIT